MSTAAVEPRRSAEPKISTTDRACLERSAAHRRAGDRLSTWLVEADAVISAADRRQIAALAQELSGRRVRGARR